MEVEKRVKEMWKEVSCEGKRVGIGGGKGEG